MAEITFVNVATGATRTVRAGSPSEDHYRRRPERWQPEGEAKPVDKMNVAELDELIDQRGLDVDKSLAKAEKAAAVAAAL